MSLSGKTTYYQALYSAKFERGFLLNAVTQIPMLKKGERDQQRNKRARVVCTTNMKSQCSWWIRRILSAEIAGDLPIPLHFECFPASHLSLYPDASGGGGGELSRGIGCVLDTWPRVFSFFMYPDNIRLGIPTKCGTRLSQKLSFLESAAALLGMTMCPELIMNTTVYIHSDNQGNCFDHELNLNQKGTTKFILNIKFKFYST